MSDGLAPFAFSSGLGMGIPSVPGSKPIHVDPTRNYVAGGTGLLPRSIPQVLPGSADDLTREFGPAVYDAMEASDPYVGGTFRLFKSQVLSNEVKIIPALQPGEQYRGDPTRAGWSDEEVLAAEVAEFVERSLCRCRTPIKTVLWQILDAAKTGNCLAEKLYEPGTGDDEGQTVLKDVKVKPRWSWLFVTDVFLDVIGVLAFDPTAGGFVVVPRSKFFILSWLMRDNDPRGTSLFRQSYRAWNVKQLIYPDYHQFMRTAAGARVFGKTSEAAETTRKPKLDEYRRPIPGLFLTAEEAMAEALQRVENGGVCVLPPGSEVATDWPKSDGSPFLKAFEYLNREIVYGILGSTRDSMEAQHGSKADSETAENRTGNLIRVAREALETGLRNDVARDLVTFRYGPDVAERLTPKITLGKVEHHDIANLMGGVARLLSAGGIDRSQLPAIHAMLDLPPAAPGSFEPGVS